MARMSEKCLEQLVVRLPYDLLRRVRELAEKDDRSTSDYIRRWLTLHVFGHSGMVAEGESEDNGNRALQCDTRK
jgi:hypothetical protein